MTTRHPVGQVGPRWAILLRPRWLAWHSFVWIAAVGMLFLGDWQLHRAESGNELSWAYTFEWPLFSVFTVYFWIKSLRDELRQYRAAASTSNPAEPTAAASGSAVTMTASAATAGRAATPAPSASATAAEPDAAAVSAAPAAPAKRADSWDATSWDATSWDPTGWKADTDGGKPVDIARATPADGDAYLARLMAEVQRTGRRRDRR